MAGIGPVSSSGKIQRGLSNVRVSVHAKEATVFACCGDEELTLLF